MIPKFRAWDEQCKKMREVVAIDFYHGTYSWISDDYIEVEQSWEYDTIEDVTLMQYTGLNDKNGREIFEGDILYIFQKGVTSHNFEAHDENRKVLFLRGSWCVENYENTGEDFGNFIIENHYPIGLYHTEDELEVIGNIYENIELLGEG